MEKKIQKILEKMTLEDKIALCSGADFWHSKAMKKYEIPSFMMSDGPHGLRVQKGEADMLGVNVSEPATCFPAAVTSGASWDRDLLEKEGRAIGEEGLSLGTDVVLGPGVNIKRDPRCGRNFEYFSEDPYLAGELGASWICGAQAAGIGTSLKHFAANNQEYKRFNGNSQMDERTLREIYLPAFEKAVKKGNPATVMCAYPMLNGVHCSDSKKLLTDILRTEWGFEGMVVTDWGALSNLEKAMEAGCDLSMPGGSGYMEDKVLLAVREGRLPESAVDQCAGRVIALALKSRENEKGKDFDKDAHSALAGDIAREGAVLLKNEGGILPLDPRDMVLIGHMAKNMRYQGSGSSHINPTRLVSLADALPEVPCAECCDEKGNITEEGLAEAARAAKGAGIPVVCAGLPDLYESEGFDREDLKMPEGHVKMIEAAAMANPNTVVVLFGGAVMELPWLGRVKAVLYMGLPGQEGGRAAADLLTGAANPSGKLTETWPCSLTDVPSFETFGKKYTHYNEGIYVGYRYYQKAGMRVRFPFGFGLSYTDFELSDLTAEGRTLRCTVENTGERAGAEVVQLYIRAPREGLHRPLRELKGFERVFLQPGEKKTVSFTLDDRSFSVWDGEWKVPGGLYWAEIGTSSENILLTAEIPAEGEAVPAPAWQRGSWYEDPAGHPSDREFERLCGGPIQKEPEIRKGAFTMEMSSMEMKDFSPIMKSMFKSTEKTIAGAFGGMADYSDPAFKMMLMSGADSPLRAAVISSGGAFPANVAEGMLEMANGHILKGLRKMGEKKEKKETGKKKEKKGRKAR